MVEPKACQVCGNALEILRHPLRRLRWSRHWGKGAASLFGRPLRICDNCGAMYTAEGELLATGAVQTEVEQRLDLYRKDMAHLRDSFGGVIVASELAAIWLFAGAEAGSLAGALLAGSIGIAAIVPFGFFGAKARRARRELKKLKEARIQGRVPSGS
jgi:hypothetical protein